MKPVLTELLNNDKNVRVIYKDFPIFGQGSQFASLAALAAAKQGKYIELYSALMKTHQSLNKNTVLGLAKTTGVDMVKLKTDMESAEVRDQLKNNSQLAEALGLGGTPAFIVAKTNGTEVKKAFFVPGSISGAALQNYIEQARKA
jgi:protein-disulfide isomerase